MLPVRIQHCHTGPSLGVTVWRANDYMSRSLLVHIDGTLNSDRNISVVLKPMSLPFIGDLRNATFQ